MTNSVMKALREEGSADSKDSRISSHPSAMSFKISLEAVADAASKRVPT